MPWLYTGVLSTGRRIGLRNLLPVATENVQKKVVFLMLQMTQYDSIFFFSTCDYITGCTEA